jgi:hypothetical protein
MNAKAWGGDVAAAKKEEKKPTETYITKKATRQKKNFGEVRAKVMRAPHAMCRQAKGVERIGEIVRYPKSVNQEF